jgi:hypothetical protein
MLAGVGGAQLAAEIRSFEVSEKIEHYLSFTSCVMMAIPQGLSF